MDTLLTKKSDYDDVDAQNISRKVAVVYAIKLVMHALAIASSFVISDADAKTKYVGTNKYNTVFINGTKTIVYGTRFMIDQVMTYVFEYGDNLSCTDLVAAFRETFRCAAQYVKEGSLMNAAIVQGLKDARDEWKLISAKSGTGSGSRFEDRPADRRTNHTFGRPSPNTNGKSPMRAPPADKPATVKGYCGAFNRREGCPHGSHLNCRNGEHKCTICHKPGHGASSVAFHPPNAPGTKRKREEAAASTSGGTPTTPTASRVRDTQMRTGP